MPCPPLEERPTRLQTPGYDGFSVWLGSMRRLLGLTAPRHQVCFDRSAHRLACASGTNFGVKGPGRLWVFEQRPTDGTWHPLTQYAVRACTSHRGTFLLCS